MSFSVLARMIELMISLSVGMMLSTSLLHALPEAFEMHVQPNRLFLTLLIGLLAFSCSKSFPFSVIHIIMKETGIIMKKVSTNMKPDRQAG